MKYLLFFISMTALADSDPLFTKVTYYDGLGEKFRVETASSWPKCVETKKAKKIFLDKTNELREVTYWDEEGKLHEAGKNNNPHVHKIVNEIFGRSQTKGNPCEDPKDSNQSTENSQEFKPTEDLKPSAIEIMNVPVSEGELH